MYLVAKKGSNGITVGSIRVYKTKEEIKKYVEEKYKEEFLQFLHYSVGYNDGLVIPEIYRKPTTSRMTIYDILEDGSLQLIKPKVTYESLCKKED